MDATDIEHILEDAPSEFSPDERAGWESARKRTLALADENDDMEAFVRALESLVAQSTDTGDEASHGRLRALNTFLDAARRKPDTEPDTEPKTPEDSENRSTAGGRTTADGYTPNGRTVEAADFTEQSIFRGVNLTLNSETLAEVRRLQEPPEDESEIDQHFGIGEIVLDHMTGGSAEGVSSYHESFTEMQLGRHWTTSSDFALTAAIAGNVSGNLKVILEARYEENGVDPDATHRGYESKTEQEVTLLPGASVQIMGVYVAETSGAGWRDYMQCLAAPVLKSASLDWQVSPESIGLPENYTRPSSGIVNKFVLVDGDFAFWNAETDDEVSHGDVLAFLNLAEDSSVIAGTCNLSDHSYLSVPPGEIQCFDMNSGQKLNSLETGLPAIDGFVTMGAGQSVPGNVGQDPRAAGVSLLKYVRLHGDRFVWGDFVESVAVTEDEVSALYEMLSERGILYASPDSDGVYPTGRDEKVRVDEEDLLAYVREGRIASRSITAAEDDVEEKARRIFRSGGVKYIGATYVPEMERISWEFTVHSTSGRDYPVYLDTPHDEPDGLDDKRETSCFCRWDSWNYDRAPAYKHLEHRYCSHLLAVEMWLRRNGVEAAHAAKKSHEEEQGGTEDRGRGVPGGEPASRPDNTPATTQTTPTGIQQATPSAEPMGMPDAAPDLPAVPSADVRAEPQGEPEPEPIPEPEIETPAYTGPDYETQEELMKPRGARRLAASWNLTEKRIRRRLSPMLENSLEDPAFLRLSDRPLPGVNKFALVPESKTSVFWTPVGSDGVPYPDGMPNHSEVATALGSLGMANDDNLILGNFANGSADGYLGLGAGEAALYTYGGSFSESDTDWVLSLLSDASYVQIDETVIRDDRVSDSSGSPGSPGTGFRDFDAVRLLSGGTYSDGFSDVSYSAGDTGKYEGSSGIDEAWVSLDESGMFVKVPSAQIEKIAGEKSRREALWFDSNAELVPENLYGSATTLPGDFKFLCVYGGGEGQRFVFWDQSASTSPNYTKGSDFDPAHADVLEYLADEQGVEDYLFSGVYDDGVLMCQAPRWPYQEEIDALAEVVLDSYCNWYAGEYEKEIYFSTPVDEQLDEEEIEERDRVGVLAARVAVARMRNPVLRRFASLQKNARLYEQKWIVAPGGEVVYVDDHESGISMYLSRNGLEDEMADDEDLEDGMMFAYPDYIRGFVEDDYNGEDGEMILWMMMVEEPDAGQLSSMRDVLEEMNGELEYQRLYVNIGCGSISIEDASVDEALSALSGVRATAGMRRIARRMERLAGYDDALSFVVAPDGEVGYGEYHDEIMVEEFGMEEPTASEQGNMATTYPDYMRGVVNAGQVLGMMISEPTDVQRAMFTELLDEFVEDEDEYGVEMVYIEFGTSVRFSGTVEDYYRRFGKAAREAGFYFTEDRRAEYYPDEGYGDTRFLVSPEGELYVWDNYLLEEAMSSVTNNPSDDKDYEYSDEQLRDASHSFGMTMAINRGRTFDELPEEVKRSISSGSFRIEGANVTYDEVKGWVFGEFAESSNFISCEELTDNQAQTLIAFLESGVYEGQISYDDGVNYGYNADVDQVIEWLETWIVQNPGALKTAAEDPTEPDDNHDHTDVEMIALVPPKEVRELLAPLGDEDVDDLHVTLCVVPAPVSDSDYEELRRDVEEWARDIGEDALKGCIAGFGSFVNDDGSVLWASIDAPNITDVRESLARMLEARDHTHDTDDKHGYTPHLTLRYSDDPILDLPEMPDGLPDSFGFDLVLTEGDEWHDVKWGSGWGDTERIPVAAAMVDIGNDIVLSDEPLGYQNQRMIFCNGSRYFWPADDYIHLQVITQIKRETGIDPYDDPAFVSGSFVQTETSKFGFNKGDVTPETLYLICEDDGLPGDTYDYTVNSLMPALGAKYLEVNYEPVEDLSVRTASEVVKAPDSFDDESPFRVFLAGSIEMGKAELWQDRVAEMLEEEDVVILNPRRDDWNSSWEQSIDDPQFNEQVSWELDCLEKSDAILLYFDPETESPISLLELGLYAADHARKIVVVCPEGFHRKGNVDVVCERYGVQQADTLQDGVEIIREQIEESSRPGVM